MHILKCRLCVPGNLNKSLVEGKIVLCDIASDAEGAIEAGAAGTIMRVGDFRDIARIYDLPASSLSMSDEADIMEYLESTRYLKLDNFFGFFTCVVSLMMYFSQ